MKWSESRNEYKLDCKFGVKVNRFFNLIFVLWEFTELLLFSSLLHVQFDTNYKKSQGNFLLFLPSDLFQLSVWITDWIHTFSSYGAIIINFERKGSTKKKKENLCKLNRVRSFSSKWIFRQSCATPFFSLSLYHVCKISRKFHSTKRIRNFVQKSIKRKQALTRF